MTDDRGDLRLDQEAGPPVAPPVELPAVGADGVSPYPCRVCGHVPAAPVSFSTCHGIVVWLLYRTYPGPFCRDCGTATFRKTTGSTLAFGWFGGISFVATPFFLLGNLLRYRKVKRLPAPQRVPMQPHWEGKLGWPMDPGRPLYLRWSMLGLVIALLMLTGFTWGVVYSFQHPDGVGSCADVSRGGWVDIVSCDDSHNARVVKIVDDREECPSTAQWAFDKDYEVWCLQPE